MVARLMPRKIISWMFTEARTHIVKNANVRWMNTYVETAIRMAYVQM